MGEIEQWVGEAIAEIKQSFDLTEGASLELNGLLVSKLASSELRKAEVTTAAKKLLDLQTKSNTAHEN